MSISPNIFQTFTVTQATELGVSGIIREATEGHDVVVQKHGVPVAAIVSMKRFDQIMQLEDELSTAALIIGRLGSDLGQRRTLDEVITLFDFDRDELEREMKFENQQTKEIGLLTELGSNIVDD